MNYNATQRWSLAYEKNGMAFPSEYVIRIFRGSYPRLCLDKSKYSQSSILDISCGDGRDLILLSQLGFQGIYGTEVASSIVDKIRSNAAEAGIPAENIVVGFNHALPFANSTFDYVLAWNVCYYMQDYSFDQYVQEYSRICKSGGTLVFSIPKKSAFIYQNAEMLDGGEYCVIKDDYFQGLRNGEKMRIFQNEDEIAEAFSPYFSDFVFGSIHDDCFGLNYHWHIGVCQCA